TTTQASVRTTPRNRSEKWTMAWSMGLLFLGRAARLQFRGQQLRGSRRHQLLALLHAADNDHAVADRASEGDEFALKRVLLAEHKDPGAALVINDRAARDDECMHGFAGPGHRGAK